MFLTVKDSTANYHAIATHTDLIKAITGCPKRTAIAIAKLLTLRGFNEIPILDLQELGLSESQYKKLKAAAEFGKRDYLSITRIDSERIEDPEIAAKHFQHLIGASSIEMGAILVLDIKHRVLYKEVFSIGTENECLFNPRRVFEIVMRHRGTRFMVAHNHPSGDTTPSSGDIALTEQLVKASNLIDIPILDHLVIAANNFHSIRQSTAIWENYG